MNKDLALDGGLGRLLSRRRREPADPEKEAAATTAWMRARRIERPDQGPNVNRGIPPAFGGLLKSEHARLENQRSRCAACGRGSGMEVEHVCGSRYWLKFGCRTRLCERCGARYRMEKLKRWRPLSRLEQSRESRLRFVTLTYPNVSWDSPAEARAWMMKRTKGLRLFFRDAPKSWKVRGYLAVWEVTPGKSGGAWHPHLHLLVWSAFIPQRQLAARWSAEGHGSIVDIRAIAQGGKAVRYVLKYVAKPWPGVPDDLQVVAFHRIRRITAVGEFYGKKFSALTAGLMADVEKREWRLWCPRCGTPEPEHPAALEACSRPWKPPGEWQSVRRVELWDLDGVTLEPAQMIPVQWNGLMAPGEPQEVKLEHGKAFLGPFGPDEPSGGH